MSRESRRRPRDELKSEQACTLIKWTAPARVAREPEEREETAMTRINRDRLGLACAAVLALGAGSYWLTVDTPGTTRNNENGPPQRRQRAEVPTQQAQVREPRVRERSSPKPVRRIREHTPRPAGTGRNIRRNRNPQPKPKKPSRIG